MNARTNVECVWRVYNNDEEGCETSEKCVYEFVFNVRFIVENVQYNDNKRIINVEKKASKIIGNGWNFWLVGKLLSMFVCQ